MNISDVKNETMISVVVLTYNRPDRVRQQYEYLSQITDKRVEIIIVDNCSEQPVEEVLPKEHGFVVIRNSTNLGAVGRNTGMANSKGEIAVTLDDDVYGLTDAHLHELRRLFASREVGAINFSIKDEGTGNIANWCHPCDEIKYFNQPFETNQISEGAVAFNKAALDEVGLYPEYFFISHEGPDLAYRLINHGWKITYSPDIVVTHAYEQKERTTWRRYYYDTRNQLWFVLRNCPFGYGLKKLIIGCGSMMIYSIRDGFFRYWVLGITDSFRGSTRSFKHRTPPKLETIIRIREIEKNKPSFFRMLRKRLWKRGVKI